MLKQNTAHKTTQTLKGTLHEMNTMQMQLINITINNKSSILYTKQ
jgi:hypothetical protein